MIIVLNATATDADVALIEEQTRELGYEPHTIRGVVRTIVAAVGDETQHANLQQLLTHPFVERVMPVQKKFKLVSREGHPEMHPVSVCGQTIEQGVFHIMAGPCAVESHDQFLESAQGAVNAGATFVRGGAYKPRTSPYDFQGLGPEALEIMGTVKQELGNPPLVSEVVRESDISLMADVIDVFQIGARNALNYALLEAVGQTGKPVLLKRGLSATMEEWFLAAEYIVRNGNPNVILCERGIRTYEKATRNTLDLGAVAVAKRETNLPVFVDPSHAAGRRDILPELSQAAAAVGADGILIEVHRNPDAALSDNAQQLRPDDFRMLVEGLTPFIEASGRTLATSNTKGTS